MIILWRNHVKILGKVDKAIVREHNNCNFIIKIKFYFNLMKFSSGGVCIY